MGSRRPTGEADVFTTFLLLRQPRMIGTCTHKCSVLSSVINSDSFPPGSVPGRPAKAKPVFLLVAACHISLFRCIQRWWLACGNNNRNAPYSSTVIAEILVRAKISYSSVRELSYAINFRTARAVSHTLLYLHGFRMLLIFVLSAKSTKNTKLNRK